MEPAMILCAAVAVPTLGIWVTWRAGMVVASVPDRLSASLSEVGSVRLLATSVLAVVGLAAVPRPADAEPMPPIVRLADEPSAPEPDRPATPNRTTTSATYEVRRGDSLWCIAAAELRARTGRRPTSVAVARFWPRVYAANRGVIGDDPDLILPGQRLVIPEP